ncbi:hypothetical protein AVEN_73542-1 [Araneus ventricosus]|uniref:Uncharacterized protein n=1 Tax=Araneus ventricosus TaxID=182803 RepID=A0A4Y2USB2_ARAVE|nr:hypothetical protein AVEN_73542-1 [Araneus ventricosus]
MQTPLVFERLCHTNSQQSTNNDNNSTFNSAQLTSFLARTADEILKSFQWINTTTQYRSASNSLLARTADRTAKSFQWINTATQYLSASDSLLALTADRTPKTFSLQGDPSRSTFTPSSKRSPYIVSAGWP